MSADFILDGGSTTEQTRTEEYIGPTLVRSTQIHHCSLIDYKQYMEMKDSNHQTGMIIEQGLLDVLPMYYVIKVNLFMSGITRAFNFTQFLAC